MIERCGSDARATAVRLVQGELERLPFAAQAFDTTISIDAFAHYPDWAANLDELVRVTRSGGRIIVDIGSRDHIEAVAQHRGCTPDEVSAAERDSPDLYVLRLSSAELHAYAADRDISLVALVPCGAVFGALVPNYWVTESYAFRSGGMDRMTSWVGADPLLFAFAQFIEREIVQRLPPAVCGRVFAIFEREPNQSAYRRPLLKDVGACGESDLLNWHGDFSGHVEHVPNRVFATSLLLAARPARLPDELRAKLPGLLLRELERAEHAAQIDELFRGVTDALTPCSDAFSFHGVGLLAALSRPLQQRLRDRWRGRP
jgi:SAM-dependent methyltransferase